MFTAGAIVVILLVLDIGCCENYHRTIAFYQDLGCTPVGDNKYYDCSEVVNVHAPGQCLFRGRRYNPGQFVDVTDGSVNSCRTGCICTAPEDSSRPGLFSCPEVDCSFLHQPEPDCRYVFSSVDSCCPDVTACGPSNVTCNYKGTIYQKGDTFFPETNPCLKCLCEEQFHMTIEGGCAGRPRMVSEGGTCKSVSCSVQLESSLIDDLNNYCAPIFKPGLCCPVEFYCPNGGEQVIDAEPQGDVRPTPGCHPAPTMMQQCRLGTLLLNIGDVLVPQDLTMHCQCFIPPFLTCWSE